MPEHSLLTGASLHEPKGIESATAGTVYVATGTGTGIWSDIAPSLIFIDQESDFPVQDGTSITLESQTVYVVSSAITTSKYFTVQDAAVITSINTLGPLLQYTGTGAMFRGTDASFTCRDIRIAAPNGNLFEFSETVGQQKLFICSFVRVDEGVKFGTFTDMQTVLLDNSSCLDLDDGITISGGTIVCSFDKFFVGTTSPTCKAVELDSTMTAPTVEINDLVVAGVPGTIGISGRTNSANLPVGSIGQVTNCEFLGGITPLENIGINDVRWSFTNNAGLEDTMEDALVSLTANATNTLISGTGVGTKVAGTWVCEREAKFTCDTTGRVTYIGERPITLPIDIVVTLESVSGTNKDISVYLAKNGTTIPNSVKTNRVSSGDPKNTTVLWQDQLIENDYLEVFVANDSDTVDLLVKDAILRVR